MFVCVFVSMYVCMCVTWQAASEYCQVNSKINRKIVATALYKVPRNRLDLLPYYARCDVCCVAMSMFHRNFFWMLSLSPLSYSLKLGLRPRCIQSSPKSATHSLKCFSASSVEF